MFKLVIVSCKYQTLGPPGRAGSEGPQAQDLKSDKCYVHLRFCNCSIGKNLILLVFRIIPKIEGL